MLPEGAGIIIDQAASDPALTQALQSALGNRMFVRYMMDDTPIEYTDAEGNTFVQSSADTIAASMAMIQQYDLPPEVIAAASTELFAEIGAGQMDGNFDQLGAVAEQKFAVAQVNYQVDQFVADNPAFANIGAIMKSNPALAYAFGNALEQDSTMQPGLDQIMAGEGGMEIAELEAMLQDPSKQVLLTNVLNAVADRGDIQFAHLDQLIQDAKAENISGVVTGLNTMGVDIPPEMAMAENFGMLQTLLQDPSQLGLPPQLSGIMGTIAEFMQSFLDPNGPMGSLFASLGMGSMLQNIAGMFNPAASGATASTQTAQMTADQVRQTADAGADNQNETGGYDVAGLQQRTGTGPMVLGRS